MFGLVLVVVLRAICVALPGYDIFLTHQADIPPIETYNDHQL
jgi:hypothetical protein